MNWRHVAALAAVSVVVYLPFLGLPFISDDYTQIRLAREFGSPAGWPALAEDPLYRCRATSLPLTWAIDALFGLSPLAHNAASLMLHWMNCVLIALLGLWRRAGFALSVPAAFFFAVYEGHQEAVVWNAALHEPLVLLFALACCLSWATWLQDGCRHWWRGAAAAVCYLLALYSKESGVVLLAPLAVIWWIERPARRAPLVHLAGYTLAAALYTAAVFKASSTHLHLNDGTFDLRAPFWLVLPHSVLRMLWIWGLISAGVLVLYRERARWRVAGLALAWMGVALLPYSFLLYQSRVPSRHTYLAAAGLAFIIAAAWRALPARGPAAALLAAALLIHNGGYLWVRKLPQYERRAEATQRFLDFSAANPGPVRVVCAPYGRAVLADAAAVALDRPLDAVLGADDSAPDAAEYCDLDHP